MYLSLGYHHCTSAIPPKRCWSLKRDDEFAVFCWADGSQASDETGNLWGFLLREGELHVLGTEGERIAKFPCPSNATDPWHGYPVHPNDDPARRPPPTFVDRMYHENLLTKVQKKRIQDSRI